MRFEAFLIPLLLFIGHQFVVLEALVLPNFFPFGASEGDQTVPSNDDGSSGRVSISVSFPFFDQKHSSLFVNTNGAMSFLVEVTHFTPHGFPLGKRLRLVAPFWADVDTRRNGGQVFYRQTLDPGLLQQATDAVKASYVNHRKFAATWLLIATWYEVCFFGSYGPNKSKRNTFQAVLITNERHSFVMFNYNNITWTTGSNSGGDSSGLGGTPAQAGFNAGDGVRYFNIPGSRTDRVLDLPNQSNVAVPGRWMFRVDNAKIEGDGCDKKVSLVVSPQSGGMLGGDNILISGPCYKPWHQIVCEFPGGKVSNGSYISDIQAYCTVPMLNVTGRLPIRMSINGSFGMQGKFTIVNIFRVRPRVTRLSKETWTEQRPVMITWDPVHLGGENQTVRIELARFSIKDDGHVFFHSMFTLISDQNNTGKAQFTVPKGQGQGANVGSGRFITLVAVKRTGDKRRFSPAEWIWSDLFSWISFKLARERCFYWYKRQPDPRIYAAFLLPCPHTLAQVMADTGQFTIDEYTNPGVNYRCVDYQFGDTTCFRTITSSNHGAGQQCCYNRPGNLMVGPLNGGSMDRVHVEVGVPVLSHFFHDLVPYLDCCLLSAHCDKYFEKRPSDNGARYRPPRPARTSGDPHMTTFDGVNYTFNGYGEYHVLRVAAPDFDLQGRMQPLINCDGNFTRATVFKAFAMKENGSDVLQVHINDRNDIEILVNGVIMEFNALSLMDFKGGFVVKCSSNYTVIFHSGMSVTVEKVEDLLQLFLLVPPSFKGNTSGLLGFRDGNTQQEFLLPNGTFLETNSSHIRIHYEFGQLWVTNANDSLFIYEEGKSHASYFDAGYVPLFLDQADLTFHNATLGKLALDVCGDNRQCLFDIHTTCKPNIGKATKKAMESLIVITNTLEKRGCIPIAKKLGDGKVLRNDSKDGRMIYTFHCNPGSRLNGSAVISCLHGQWNGSKPSCYPIVCRTNVSIENGRVHGNNNSVGSHYWFTCNKDFTLIGPHNIQCGEDGQWNGTLPICIKVCPAIGAIENGRVHGNDISVGSRYWFTCNKGFMLIGTDNIQCGKDGQWNGTLPKCVKDCDPIDNKLSNGKVLRNDSEDGRMIYTFHCNPGFRLHGFTVISCFQGQWNGSKPSCLLIACLAIESIENGRVHGNDISVGSRYWFTCNKGFTLIGADFFECGEDGQWNGELPKCTKVCPPIGSFENGRIHGNGTSVGSRYWFTCNKGFTLIGADYIECGEDAQWNGTLPKCGKDIPNSETRSQTQWYIHAAVGLAGGVAFIVATAVIVVICFRFKRRRKRYQGGNDEKGQVQALNATITKQDFSFNNPAFASNTDLK